MGHDTRKLIREVLKYKGLLKGEGCSAGVGGATEDGTDTFGETIFKF